MASTRILVVDDEIAILDYVSRVLTAAGYETLCATGAKQALEIIAGSGRIDLVISDLEMPEMRGPELVAEIIRRSPRTSALLISAYSGPTKVSGGVPFLSKPFRPADLVAKVAELLRREQKPRQNRKPNGVVGSHRSKKRAG